VSLKEIKSLNIVQRKNEYRRIKQENERILERLMNKPSHFDWVKMEKHAKHHKKLL